MSNNKNKKVTFEDYKKAMDEMNEKGKKEFQYISFIMTLGIIFVFVGILIYVFSTFDSITISEIKLQSILSNALIPYIITCTLCLALFSFPLIIKALRCPNCGHFFPKGKLEKFTSIQGTSSGMTTDGKYYTRQSTKHIYWTRCKYCSHVIWVTKGG